MTSNIRKTALVTGAGSGIGAAVAMGLARGGFSLVLAGRRAEPLETTAARIRQEGGAALSIPADVSDPRSVDELFAVLRDKFGRLDVLFNNAGISAPATAVEDLAAEQWDAVIRVNLTGAFLCAQAAFRLMKSQQPGGGRIINNGSLSASVPRLRSVAYTASKHGVTGLTKSLSLEGRAHNIACGQIDIGNAETSIGSHAAKGALQANGSTAVEPMLDLTHVVAAVNYMASLPLEANVQFMTVMATKMPFVGRG